MSCVYNPIVEYVFHLYLYLKSFEFTLFFSSYVVLDNKGSRAEAEDDELAFTKCMIMIGIVITLYVWKKQKKSRRYPKLKNKQ